MARSFNLLLTGTPLQGHTREECAVALARLMRLPESRALELLSGQETVVKRDLDGATLHRYLEALRAAGVETRKEEMFPAPGPVAPATVECPACGTEQPDLTLCRKCGTNMQSFRAAQAEEARKPVRRPAAPAVAGAVPKPEPDPETPRYRRSRVFEVLLFLFVSVLWGFLAMTDSTRGKAMRAFGGVTFAVFGSFMAMSVAGFFKSDAEREDVLNAAIYANAVAGEVGKYAIANQRMPERTVSIDLPAGQPKSVKTVSIGRGGQVRVQLSDDLKKASGGAIVFTPIVEKGVIDWKCASENVPADYLAKICD